jgi:hypothetical protein
MYCDGYFQEINLVIEFDGRQHKIPIDKYGGEKAFVRLQENDKLKEQLVKDHNIRLLRIDSKEEWYENEHLKQRLQVEGVY